MAEQGCYAPRASMVIGSGWGLANEDKGCLMAYKDFFLGRWRIMICFHVSRSERLATSLGKFSQETLRSSRGVFSLWQVRTKALYH